MARTHAEQGSAIHYPRQDGAPMSLYGDEPDVGCLYWKASALWYLGYPYQALEQVFQALRSAHEIARPYAVSAALFWTAFIHQSRREAQETRQQTEALLALAHEQEDRGHSVFGSMWHGWALAEQGKVEEGMRRSGRASPTSRRWGKRWEGRIVDFCWPRRTAKEGGSRKR